MDSRKIAGSLESLHPLPPPKLDSEYQSGVDALMGKPLTTIRSVFVCLVPRTLLNPSSQEYFVQSRQKSVGMTLEELEKDARRVSPKRSHI